MRNLIGFALVTSLALIACSDPEPGAPAIDAAAVPLDGAAGPSTDPAAPTPLTAGVTVAATYAGQEHFFVFTAPAAGTYTLHFTGPVYGQANHCVATGGCLCDRTVNGGNCCFLDPGQSSCEYVVRTVRDTPLTAGQVVYPGVYMRPGVGGPYTIAITGPA